RPVVRVAAAPTLWHGEQRYSWQLLPRRAVLDVTAELHASPPASFVEWEMPAGIAVDGVDGPGLRYWSKTGTRLQVWLDEPRDTVELHWHGGSARANEAARFDAPAIRLNQADVTTKLKIT